MQEQYDVGLVSTRGACSKYRTGISSGSRFVLTDNVKVGDIYINRKTHEEAIVKGFYYSTSRDPYVPMVFSLYPPTRYAIVILDGHENDDMGDWLPINQYKKELEEYNEYKQYMQLYLEDPRGPGFFDGNRSLMEDEQGDYYDDL